MTDIEQKALELVKRLRARRSPNYMLLSNGPPLAPDRDCQEAADWIEAHAAEMREQAERFSEAVDAAIKYGMPPETERNLRPFILAPVDPLAEVIGMIRTSGCQTDDERAETLRAALEARGWQVGPIVKKEAV